ncbi:MAG: hypothetical protein WGN25_01610 [Candidatus Electrothrix sp. GW3-4]|uniref:hypothetical protein n=1 Tax=Candidatus Electrothrix sp. GW3-4 TaxID=3126740 RepID=UPI0030CEC2B8
MIKFKAILDILSAISAIIAAYLWFKSTLVKVQPSKEVNENGWQEATIMSDGADVIETGRQQNLWNRYAALFASIAALAQGISLLIQID